MLQKKIKTLYLPKNLNLKNYDLKKDELFKIFKKLHLIRKIELKLAYEKKMKNIKGPVHLTVGQEAIPVGISYSLKKGDSIFGNHRSHAHLLSLGTNLNKFFSEILAKNNGLSGGMGGSMHLIDKKNGFLGSVPIVGATVPIAVGSALTKKHSKKKNISICYFGDSALEEGSVLESLNLAAVWQLPILFVVENNFYASHMHIRERQISQKLTRFAKLHNINHEVVSGNNIFDIIKKSKDLINLSRNKSKPTFLEAITYRHLGHVDWREDIDVGVSRSLKELNSWKKQDPLINYRRYLLKKGIKKNKIELLEKKNEKLINKSWNYANNQSFPNLKKIEKYLYE